MVSDRYSVVGIHVERQLLIGVFAMDETYNLLLALEVSQQLTFAYLGNA